MILLGMHGQRLTLDVPPGTPADDDLLLNVSVTVGGYCAEDQCWVCAREWRVFLTELRQLERTRQGRADLSGASPEEFKLRIASTDRAGHMAVSGLVGWRRPDEFLQRLEFGFAFDPGMLAALIRELGNFARGSGRR
jgi:hypothetical protein